MEYKLHSRIKSLREENNLTQRELAKVINIGYSTLSQYESGLRIPSDEIKISIASYFNVSMDYLMGLSDIKNPYTDKNVDIEKEIEEEDPLSGYEIAAHKEGDEDFTLEQKIAIANLIEETLKKIEKGKKDKDI